MKQPSLFAHLKAIIILPVTVTIIIPSLISDESSTLFFYSETVETVGILLLLSGLFLFFYTVILFRRKGKGTLAPWDATQKLVIAGPYKYTRNPMITSVLFILLGEAFTFNSWDIFVWAGIFFIINNFYFLYKEEPDLAKRFGEDYRNYKESVPRWIPKLKPYNQDND